MTTQPKGVQPIPEGYHSVTPWIISRDTAKILDFMRKAFGAQELGRIYNEDGTIGHAEAKIGDSIVMAFDTRVEAAQRLAFRTPLELIRRHISTPSVYWSHLVAQFVGFRWYTRLSRKKTEPNAVSPILYGFFLHEDTALSAKHL